MYVSLDMSGLKLYGWLIGSAAPPATWMDGAASCRPSIAGVGFIHAVVL